MLYTPRPRFPGPPSSTKEWHSVSPICPVSLPTCPPACSLSLERARPSHLRADHLPSSLAITSPRVTTHPLPLSDAPGGGRGGRGGGRGGFGGGGRGQFSLSSSPCSLLGFLFARDPRELLHLVPYSEADDLPHANPSISGCRPTFAIAPRNRRWWTWRRLLGRSWRGAGGGRGGGFGGGRGGAPRGGGRGGAREFYCDSRRSFTSAY